MKLLIISNRRTLLNIVKIESVLRLRTKFLELALALCADDCLMNANLIKLSS